MSIVSVSEKTLAFLREAGHERQAEEYERLIEHSGFGERIPSFFFTKDDFARNNFRNLLTTIAAQNSLEQITQLYPTETDVKNLRKTFDEMTQGSGALQRSKTMKYTQYKQLSAKASPNLRPILSSKLFLEIGGQSMHTINVDELFKHLEMIPLTVRHFVQLKSQDMLQTGLISEAALKEYVTEMSQDMLSVEDKEEEDPEFREYFITFVTQRIMVVLDPLRTGRVALDTLIREPMYAQFVMMELNVDEKQNPFDLGIISCVADEFRYIDEDEDGILVPSDLLRMKYVKFTKVFADRVFETFAGHSPADFSWFVRFRVAWDNLGAPWANLFMFDALDIDGDGFISQYEINVFHRELIEGFKQAVPGRQVPTIDSIINEKFDMFGCATLALSKDEFVKSKNSEFLVRQLTDLRAFVRCETNEDLPEFLE